MKKCLLTRPADAFIRVSLLDTVSISAPVSDRVPTTQHAKMVSPRHVLYKAGKREKCNVPIVQHDYMYHLKMAQSVRVTCDAIVTARTSIRVSTMRCWSGVGAFFHGRK